METTALVSRRVAQVVLHKWDRTQFMEGLNKDVLVTFYSSLGQIPNTQNEGRKGLFSSQFVEVSGHIWLAQG